jgi:hypothetical protein
MRASKAKLILQIHGLGAECIAQCWEGNGAKAVNKPAVPLSEALVLALPDGVPLTQSTTR